MPRMTKMVSMVALALLVGCGSSLEGEVTVDGVPLLWNRCESLAPAGHEGVDLISEDERTIRLLSEGGALVKVGFFEPEADVGADLGACATGEVVDTNMEVNGVRVLEGQADLDCNATVRLIGSVMFSGCH